MLNRAVLILKLQEPGLNWLNQVDANDSSPMTLEEANMENTVYLISEEDSESPDTLNAWLELNYQNLFETELENWYGDESVWPENRTYSLFKQWFSAECHTVIIDTVNAPLIDDED